MKNNNENVWYYMWFQLPLICHPFIYVHVFIQVALLPALYMWIHSHMRTGGKYSKSTCMCTSYQAHQFTPIPIATLLQINVQVAFGQICPQRELGVYTRSTFPQVLTCMHPCVCLCMRACAHACMHACMLLVHMYMCYAYTHSLKLQIVSRNKCMNVYKKEMYSYVKKGSAESLSKDQATHKHFLALYMYMCM